MSRVENRNSTSSLLYTVIVLGLVAIVFCFGLTTNRSVEAGSDKGTDKGSVASAAPSATFAADSASLGTFPDGTGTPTCGNAGSGNRDVTFTVTGISGTVSSVSVDFNARHTWVNDLDVSLRAPSGSPNLLLFGRTGSTSTSDCGTGITPAMGSNDLVSTNTYTFSDTASAVNWWTTAGSATLIPTSTNRTVVTGGPGVTNPPATTSLNTTFGGMTAAAANGTWVLRFTDRGVGDTGAVNAANLTINTSVPAGQHYIDFDGDGKTDYAIVRNTGGGPTGQVTWMTQMSGSAAQTFVPWGIATDFFVPADYDGDGKTDVAIWRPGPPFSASWFIFQSQTQTVRGELFGQTGDDPTALGDYDGDGKADMIVYRAGVSSGDPSFWYWRATPNGPIFNRQWGQNGDFIAPGDYDGDHKADFAVQRNNGGGQAAFFINYNAAAAGTLSRIKIFGTPTDVVVPGDYDGDGKTDLATIRGSGGGILWNYEPSTALNTIVTRNWGLSATDFPTQGDYDGDGKTDLAVWRPDANPVLCTFYALKSSDAGLIAYPWGANGDYPIANYNSH